MRFTFKLPFQCFCKIPEKICLQWGKGQVCLLVSACDLSTGEVIHEDQNFNSVLGTYQVQKKPRVCEMRPCLRPTAISITTTKTKLKGCFIHCIFSHGWVGPRFSLAACGKAECHNGNCVVTVVCFLLWSCESERKEVIQTPFRATHPET